LICISVFRRSCRGSDWFHVVQRRANFQKKLRARVRGIVVFIFVVD
jgi:hypothetical protein